MTFGCRLTQLNLDPASFNKLFLSASLSSYFELVCMKHKWQRLETFFNTIDHVIFHRLPLMVGRKTSQFFAFFLSRAHGACGLLWAIPGHPGPLFSCFWLAGGLWESVPHSPRALSSTFWREKNVNSAVSLIRKMTLKKKSGRANHADG